jgi:hypothetical protein
MAHEHAALDSRLGSFTCYGAGPNGVTLLYDDGLVILLRLVSGCWSAMVVGPDSIRKVDRASENGDWL